MGVACTFAPRIAYPFAMRISPSITIPESEFVERVTDYLEQALEPTDRTRLEEHLAECGPCRDYLEQLRRTRVLD